MAKVMYYDVLLKPLVTEKSMMAMAEKRYSFYVHVDSTKNMVREAVEKMFPGTKVAKVNTVNCPTKKRRTRTYKYGTTVKRKKAIVTLTAESAEIEIFQGM